MGHLAPPRRTRRENGIARRVGPSGVFARGKTAIGRWKAKCSDWLCQKVETLLLLATLGAVALWLVFWFGP